MNSISILGGKIRHKDYLKRRFKLTIFPESGITGAHTHTKKATLTFFYVFSDTNTPTLVSSLVLLYEQWSKKVALLFSYGTKPYSDIPSYVAFCYYCSCFVVFKTLYFLM